MLRRHLEVFLSSLSIQDIQKLMYTYTVHTLPSERWYESTSCPSEYATITNQHAIYFTADVVPPAVPETPCCMCNCKGTLQAILQELRAMRRLMQTQKGQWMSTDMQCESETEREEIQCFTVFF